MFVDTIVTAPLSSLLTASQAAAYLRMAEKTLKNWRLSGKGSNYVRFRKFIYYRQVDLDDFICRSILTPDASDVAHAPCPVTQHKPDFSSSPPPALRRRGRPAKKAAGAAEVQHG